MGIYVKNNNALLLKNDRNVAEFYKGNTKVFGYNDSKQGKVITADNVHPIEHNLKIKLSSDSATDFSGVNVTRCGKNLFDADTVLPSLENPNLPYDICKWKKQNDGSFFMGNLGGLVNYKWFENTVGQGGQVSFSLSSKAINGTSEHYTLNIVFYYTDGSKESLHVRNDADYTTYIFKTDAEKTLSYIYQSYNSNAQTYVKDVMIAFGNHAEYEPYNSQIVTANVDGTVDGLTSLTNMTVLTDSDDIAINCEYVACG